MEDAFKLYKTGVIAGNFDVIHPGYIAIFNTMKEVCQYNIILLHDDPSIERPEKLKPILTIDERISILGSLKQIDRIVPYKFEHELVDLLKSIQPDVRFLGDDYRDRDEFTGSELNIPIHYLNRDHGWSTTRFKENIVKSYHLQNNELPL